MKAESFKSRNIPRFTDGAKGHSLAAGSPRRLHGIFQQHPRYPTPLKLRMYREGNEPAGIISCDDLNRANGVTSCLYEKPDT